MGSRDSRVDAYIAGVAPFAEPILTHLREVVHGGCPAVTETIKWGFPHFEHKGVLCSMAAFKAHCAFGFWHPEMRGQGPAKSGEAMGQFGRITRLTDLPRDAALTALVRKAAALNEAGIKPVRLRKDAPSGVPEAPDDLAAALAQNAKARTTYEAFSNTHKREYVDWIEGAKRPETRATRVVTAIEWMAEGKVKEWRYVRR